MPESPKKTQLKWHHPSEVMKLHSLKLKKKALQARIAGGTLNKTTGNVLDKSAALEEIISVNKRKNPFVKSSDSKKCKQDVQTYEESSDQTLFKLLHQNPCSTSSNTTLTSFKNIFTKEQEPELFVVKAREKSYVPVDWTLKSKLRLLSAQPFLWSNKLKVSEEASGTTGFVRCLNSDTTNLDSSPNAKFYQTCLFWQQPSLPWLSLFPRTSTKTTVESVVNLGCNQVVRESLQNAFKDSFRSLFQLLRTKQCPYFYVCSNSFTVLFRAAGICGISDIHVLITPTTRGLRHMLRQEDIEFSMPLKKRLSDQGYETLDSTATDENAEEDEDPLDEEWLKSMGLYEDDIKQINYTQAKILHRTECEVDNSHQSLVLVEGVEVHAFYNFLINCKSATAPTGPLAGIPPTLLAPVAFNGATLKALKVRENKVHVDNTDYYSVELSGPILPSTVHNLFSINPAEHSLSATFVNVASTLAFSKLVRSSDGSKGNIIFDKENLSDCGLNNKILEQFCKSDTFVTNVECLKYNGDNKTYTWT